MVMLSINPSFGQKIVHLDGSFDLDGDNLLEFISLELDPSKNVFPTMVRNNEMDNNYKPQRYRYDVLMV